MKRLPSRHPEPVIGQDTVPAPDAVVMDRTIGRDTAHFGWDAAYAGAPAADLLAAACGVAAPTDSAGLEFPRHGADVALDAGNGASGTLLPDADLNDDAFASGVSLRLADPTTDFFAVVTSAADRSADDTAPLGSTSIRPAPPPHRPFWQAWQILLPVPSQRLFSATRRPHRRQ